MGSVEVRFEVFGVYMSVTINITFVSAPNINLSSSIFEI